MGYRKVPGHFLQALSHLEDHEFMVGASRDISSWEEVNRLPIVRLVGAGRVGSGETVEVIPDWNSRFARINVQGEVRLRKDLPKIEKDFFWQAPNFGRTDTHPIVQSRKVWQREAVHGRSISLSVLAAEKSSGRFVVTVRAEHLFDRKENSQSDDLLMACSLVKEALHSEAHPLPATLSRQAWEDSLIVRWSFLSPGTYTAPQIYNAALNAGKTPSTSSNRDVLIERIEMIQSTHPGRVIIGTSGTQRYVGFQYRDDLVAMENFAYGNALYLMYEEWSTLSRKSRLELLSGDMKGFDRVVHAGKWRDQFRNLLTLHKHDSRE